MKITYQDGSVRILKSPVTLEEVRDATQKKIEQVEHLGVVRNRTAGLLYLLKTVTDELELESQQNTTQG
jgi:hypothetical protein